MRSISNPDKVLEKIIPGMCHWSHPENIAWFPNIQPRVTIGKFSKIKNLKSNLRSTRFDYVPFSASLLNVDKK